MRKRTKRLLSLIFVVCMLVGLIPVNVYATSDEGMVTGDEALVSTVSGNELKGLEEDSLESAEQLLSPDSTPETVSGNDYSDGNDSEDRTFQSFDDLKTICENSNTTSGMFNYVGDEALVISDNLELPWNIRIDLNGKELEVSQDAEFTINNEVANCGKVIVEGTFNVNTYFRAMNGMVVNGTVNIPNGSKVGKELIVTGRINVQQTNIDVDYGTRIEGIDNIVFDQEWGKIYVENFYTSASDLRAKLEEVATNFVNHSRIIYRMWASYEGDAVSNCIINESLTVPAHVILALDNRAGFELEAGKTITNYGEITIFVPMTINGTLDNQGTVDVYRINDGNGSAMISNEGAYTGGGNLYVHTSDTVTDITTVVSGFGFTNENFGNNAEGNVLHWYLFNGNQGDPGNQQPGETFATEEELIAIINKNDSTERRVTYNGTTALEITQDLAIPSYLKIGMYEQELIIPSNVTLTAGAEIDCNKLTVAGTMHIAGRLHVQDSIKVTGKLCADTGFDAGKNLDVSGELEIGGYGSSMSYPAQISGLDKIRFRDEWQSITINMPFTTMSELTTNLSDVSSNYINHSRIEYVTWFNVNEAPNVSEFVITEDLTIPAHVRFFVQNLPSFVLDTGKTLTVNGDLIVHEAFNVKGTIVNNGWTSVENVTEYFQHGVITFENGAKFIGSSELHLVGDSNIAGPGALIQGINLNDYDISSYFDPSGNTQWSLKNAAGLIKLATPKNPAWGTQYVDRWSYNPTKDTYEITGYDVIPKAGYISWETDRPDQAEVNVKVYRVEEDGAVLVADERSGYGEDVEPLYRSTDVFLRSDLPSGKYYFTVQSLADYKEYRNSDIATSGFYEYVQPSGKLTGCSNLQWEDRNDEFFRWVNWDNLTTDRKYVDGYEVKFYYSPTENGSYTEYGAMFGRGNRESESPFHDHYLQEMGTGFYKFKVRALSRDIEQMGNSPWSEFSPALNVSDIPQQMNQNLGTLINSSANATPEDIRTEVQKLDTQDLKAALLTDKSNSESTDKLKQLEQKAGGSAPITVTQDAAVFNTNDISIVGANLNNKKDSATDPIQLVVDRPEEEHVIPELYNSSVAVKFSMTLDNVEDPKNLKVPVKITLPVPESINPEFLVVFHYHVDGTYEILWPYVHVNNGKYYADFVLTSFSDFVMTALHECIWDAGEKLAEPTYTTDGEILHKCTVASCDKVWNEIIPKLSNNNSGNNGSGSSSSGTSGTTSNTAPATKPADSKAEAVNNQKTNAAQTEVIATSHMSEKVSEKETTTEEQDDSEYYESSGDETVVADEEAKEEIEAEDTEISMETGDVEVDENSMEISETSKGNNGFAVVVLVVIGVLLFGAAIIVIRKRKI